MKAAVRSLLQKRGRLQFLATGTSMLPLIAPATHLTVVACTDYQVGDVVLAAVGERLIMHRLLRLEGDRFWLKGDARVHGDPPMRTQDVLGRVEVPPHPLMTWLSRTRYAIPLGLRLCGCLLGLLPGGGSARARRVGYRLELSEVNAREPRDLVRLVARLGLRHFGLRRWELTVAAAPSELWLKAGFRVQDERTLRLTL